MWVDTYMGWLESLFDLFRFVRQEKNPRGSCASEDANVFGDRVVSAGLLVLEQGDVSGHRAVIGSFLQLWLRGGSSQPITVPHASFGYQPMKKGEAINNKPTTIARIATKGEAFSKALKEGLSGS